MQAATAGEAVAAEQRQANGRGGLGREARDSLFRFDLLARVAIGRRDGIGPLVGRTSAVEDLLAGEMDEARTECSSVQRLAEVATWLGATEEQGSQLAERYSREVYPRMPDAYLSDDCVVDGPWDQTPGDGQWP